MDVKIILKLHLQQKYLKFHEVEVSFHEVFQCLEYHHLKAIEKSMMYTEVKTT